MIELQYTARYWETNVKHWSRQDSNLEPPTFRVDALTYWATGPNGKRGRNESSCTAIQL